MTFQFNDRVQVVDTGRTGRFIEYTPNGQARVFLNENDDVLIRPENLISTSRCTLPRDDDEAFTSELQVDYESYLERRECSCCEPPLCKK